MDQLANHLGLDTYAPKAGSKSGRPAFAVDKLQGVDFLQQWFGQSDPAVEKALYDTPLSASFVGLDLGIDAETGLVHTVVATAANVADVTQAHRHLHGQETDVFSDAGYQGVDKRAENQGKPVTWHVAMRPGKRRALDKRSLLGAVVDALERSRARMCPRVSIRFGCLHASSATARRSIGAWSRTARSSMS